MNKRNILFLSLLFFWGFDAYSRVTSPSAVQDACHAVWKVQTEFDQGTGFSVSSKHLITNLHVLEKSLLKNRFWSIILRQEQNPQDIKLPKGILALSIVHDLALLEIETEFDSYLNLSRSPLNKGEKHFISGYPSGRFRIMETIEPIKENVDELFVSTNSFNFSGASGSPLLDVNAKVTGVLYSGAENVAVSTPQTTLKKFIEENKNNICKQSEYKECLTDLTENFLKKIESGSATATDLLQFSGIFREGRLGFKQNDQKAYELADKANQRGNLPSAKYDKAVMLYHGFGVKQDLQQAFVIFSELAEQGYIVALFYKAVMLFNGEGVKEDLQQAFGIFSELAEKGHTGALYYKAVMLYHGFGVKQDRQQASKILSGLVKPEELDKILSELVNLEELDKILSELKEGMP